MHGPTNIKFTDIRLFLFNYTAIFCEFRGFHCGVIEDYGVLGCGTVSLGDLLPVL